MYDVPEAKFTDASPSYSKAGKYYQWNVFVPGFFFGRMDVMYNSFAELEKKTYVVS
jgi:hypothetical protein